MTKYKEITEKINNLPYIDYCSFSDNINKLIEKLQEIKRAAESKGYYNISIEVDYCRSYYDSIDHEVIILGTRMETEAERKKRLAANKKARETRKQNLIKQEQEERALLAKLKEKYE